MPVFPSGRSNRFAVWSAGVSVRWGDTELADAATSSLGDRKTHHPPRLPLHRRPLPMDRQLRSPHWLHIWLSAVVRSLPTRDVQCHRRAWEKNRHCSLPHCFRQSINRALYNVLRQPDLQLRVLQVLQLYSFHGQVLQQYGGEHQLRNLLMWTETDISGEIYISAFHVRLSSGYRLQGGPKNRGKNWTEKYISETLAV